MNLKYKNTLDSYPGIIKQVRNTLYSYNSTKLIIITTEQIKQQQKKYTYFFKVFLNKEVVEDDELVNKKMNKQNKQK